MRPRLRELGYLAVLAKHSAGRRPAVSSARVWRGSSVLAACGWPQMTPNRLPSSDAGVCCDMSRLAGSLEAQPKPENAFSQPNTPPNSLPG